MATSFDPLSWRLELARTEPSARWPVYLGAAAATAIVGSLLVALAMRGIGHDVPAAADASREAVPVDETLAVSAPVDVELIRARDELRAALDRRSESMSPSTQSAVMEGLAVIEGTITSLAAAVEANPDNSRLARMLASAYQKEIGLLRRALRLPEERVTARPE